MGLLSGGVGLGGEGVYIMDTRVKRVQVDLRWVDLVRGWSRSKHTMWVYGKHTKAFGLVVV